MRNHVFEDMILLAKGAEFISREVGVAFRFASARCGENLKYNRPIEIFVRKSVEKHIVDETEDDHASPDTKSQSRDRLWPLKLAKTTARRISQLRSDEKKAFGPLQKQ